MAQDATHTQDVGTFLPIAALNSLAAEVDRSLGEKDGVDATLLAPL